MGLALRGIGRRTLVMQRRPWRDDAFVESVHRFARWSSGTALVTYLAIHLVKGQKPSGRAVDVVLYAVFGVGVVVMALTSESLRRRRWTVHATRRGEGMSVD